MEREEEREGGREMRGRREKRKEGGRLGGS